MVKIIRKISYPFMILFLVLVVFILMAQKLDWPVNSAILPIFLINLVLTALSMLIVSIAAILETIGKIGKKNFCKRFMIKWLLFFVPLLVAALLKNDIDISIILGSSFALSILNYFFITKEYNTK